MVARVDPDTFDQRVERRDDDCWIWTGGRMGNYGTFGHGQYAHRVAFERANGPIPAGMLVDHICHVPLCVNPAHLRLATPQQNAMNSRAIPRSSAFKGVSLYRRVGRWYASIRVDGRTVSLGLHRSEEDAARAYDAAARTHFGEFAVVNFPEAA